MSCKFSAGVFFPYGCGSSSTSVRGGPDGPDGPDGRTFIAVNRGTDGENPDFYSIEIDVFFMHYT